MSGGGDEPRIPYLNISREPATAKFKIILGDGLYFTLTKEDFKDMMLRKNMSSNPRGSGGGGGFHHRSGDGGGHPPRSSGEKSVCKFSRSASGCHGDRCGFWHPSKAWKNEDDSRKKGILRRCKDGQDCGRENCQFNHRVKSEESSES